MKKHALIAIAAAALASGCSLAPDYHRPAAPVSAAFPSGGVYETQPGAQGAAANAQNRAAADIGWSEFFADPRLKRLIQLSLENNRDLRVAALKIEEARAQYRVERANLAPTVSATGSGTRARTPGNLSGSGRPAVGGEYSVAAGASWELDFFGKVRSLSEQALQTYLATAQARKAAQISLVSSVADQYLTMVAYDEMLKSTQDTLEAATSSYKLTQLQFDNGVGSELEVREAEGAMRQAQANHESQERSRAQAENALALLVGEPLPADLPPGLTLSDQGLLSDVSAGLPSDLLARRPDIMEAEATLKGANANIGAARAAFFPSISLTGSAGYASASLGSLFKPGQLAWSFGPTISVPIFNGGQNKANLDLATLEKDAAVAQYEKAIQAAFREVSDGLAARGTYDRQIAALEANELAQRRRFDLSSLRYRNGVDSYLSVLTAQTDLYSAQQSLVAASLARQTNLVDLYRSLGGGWIENTGDEPPPADAPGRRAPLAASSAAMAQAPASAAATR